MAAPSIQTQPLKAYGISRVSLLLQVGNYSIEAQGTRLKSLEQKFGFQIPDGYLLDDQGYSGTNFNRPALRAAIKGIRAGEAQAVVFPYLDRFARNVEGGLHTIRVIREAGGHVLLGDYGWVTDEKHFKMQLCMGLLIAEIQRDEIAAKSHEGIMAKVKRGLAHGGRSPFGWHFVTALEILEQCIRANQPIPTGKAQNIHRRVLADIETLMLMGQLALAGAGARGICRELLARGIKSPSGKPRWNPTTVSKIICDKANSTGLWHWGKRETVAPAAERIRNHNPDRRRTKTSWRMRPQSQWSEPQKLDGGPVWTPAEQEAIIEALKLKPCTVCRGTGRDALGNDCNACNGKGKRGTGGRPATEHGYKAVLSTLVTCRLCDYAVVPKHKSTPAGGRCWYGCSHRDRVTGEHLCEAGRHTIRAAVLEEATKEAIEQALSVDLDSLIEQHRQEILASTVDPTELDRLKAQEKRLIAKKAEAQQKGLDADDPDDKRVYANAEAGYKAQLIQIRRQLANVTAATDVPAVDTAGIAEAIRATLRIEDRDELHEALKIWIAEMKWAYEEAEITLRIPTKGLSLVANCKRDQPDVYSLRPSHDAYIYLKPIRIRVAA